MENSYLFFIGISLGLICFGFLVYSIIRFCKSSMLGLKEIKIEKSLAKKLLVLVGVQGLFTVLSSYGFSLWGSWNLNIGEHFLLSVGSYLLGTGFAVLFASFVIYYYKPQLIEKQRKIIRYIMFASIPVALGGLVAFVYAIGGHLIYPLPNGIDFTKGFAYPNVTGGFTVAFYGIVIVAGAVIVYFVVDHKVYQKYQKHGLIDTLFLVVFPMGIVGGRLWYCLVLEPKVYLADPVRIFQVWDGGLAIQGGALLGILSGIAFVLIFRRYMNLRWLMDVVLPSILIAQAIGRWGNFFNCEVHGNAVPIISFLPSFITNNMQYSSNAPSLVGTDTMYLPLFLIESIMNFAGYFIIRYAIGKPLKKFLSLGDQGMMYIIWYGLTRVLLENLRYGTTSSDTFRYSQSWITAFVMIGVGTLGIIFFHVFDFIRKRKGYPDSKQF